MVFVGRLSRARLPWEEDLDLAWADVEVASETRDASSQSGSGSLGMTEFQKQFPQSCRVRRAHPAREPPKQRHKEKGRSQQLESSSPQ